MNIKGNENKYPVGTCQFMCPVKERNQREREGLVHRLEALPFTHNQSQVENIRQGNRMNDRSRSRREPIKADENKIVKSYSRSAAGVDKTRPEDLRPPKILLKTLIYLCNDVLTRNDHPFNVIYDFVFDRLRAIRQDIVVQRISNCDSIKILETVVRFHIYSGYKLRNEAVSVFDPYINKKHMQDCLHTLIQLYEINDFWDSSRIEFESLYLIVNPESYTKMARAFSISHLLTNNNNQIYNSAIEICLAHQSKNYVRFFKLINEFPPLLAVYLSSYTKFMRCCAFQSISIAYGLKNCSFSFKKIQEILCYPDEPSYLKSDIDKINATICEKKNEKNQSVILSIQFYKDKKDKPLEKMETLCDKLSDRKIRWQDFETDCNPIIKNYLLKSW